MKLRLGLGALLAAFAALPAPAIAQGAIGSATFNAEMRRKISEGLRECEAGIPMADKWVVRAKTMTQQTMVDYFALSSTSKAKAIKHVFAVQEPSLSWKGPEGNVAITALGPQLDTPVPELTPVAFVLGNDGATARGIWQARYTDPARKSEYYAIDFVLVTNGLFDPDNFKILHLTLVPGDTPPPSPTPYCHLDEVRPW